TKNVRLTEQIAAFHAEAFDEKKRLYYSEESFDDYYYGKGSTYPDGNGCIGILFEQASARGHVQESIHGDLTFPFAIDNQFITTLSTLEAGRRLRGELLEYQQEFFRDALRAGGKASSAGYVFGDPEDRGKTLAMLDLLLRHDIDVYELNKSQNVNGTQVGPGSGYFVPNRQAQHTLVRSVFEPVTEFPDSLFYDVSTWCLPMSMGVPFAPSSSSGRGREVTSLPSLSVPTPPPSSQGSYGYAFAWDEYYAPRLLGRLHQAGIRTKVATRPFTARTTNGTQPFDFGSILIPTGLPGNDNPALQDLLRMGAEEDGVLVSPLVSGLTPSGIDLGSPSLRTLTAPNPLLVIGSGVSSYESGEVWHLLDQRFGIKVNLVEKTRLPNVNLDDYTHLLMVNGNYGSFSEDMVDRIKDWVRSGGILVASKSAVRWVNSVELVALENVDNDEASEEDETPQRIPYARAGADSGSRLTSGAIFEAHVDNTHPLGYGLHDKIAVFRNSNRYIEPVDNPYGNVVQYTSDPFLSGYVTDENLDKLRDSAVAISHRVGGGAVIALVDNPNFRGVWYGTNKLYLNALFFGSIINRTGE
ncbi:MAG: zinc carboxypeptidase, partial [Candidatus Eisenbacteria bacterium]|nr:zinc carboxypeptidase [Candidatus Eisenbacteria bacterium]